MIDVNSNYIKLIPLNRKATVVLASSGFS